MDKSGRVLLLGVATLLVCGVEAMTNNQFDVYPGEELSGQTYGGWIFIFPNAYAFSDSMARCRSVVGLLACPDWW